MSVTEKWNNSILKQYVQFKKDTTVFLGRKEMMNAFEAACDATFKLYGY